MFSVFREKYIDARLLVSTSLHISLVNCREFSLLAGVEAQQLEENIFNDCACPADYPKPHPQSPHVCVPRDYVIGSDVTSVRSRYSGNDLHIPQMMLDFDLISFWVSGTETPVTVEIQLPTSHLVGMRWIMFMFMFTYVRLVERITAFF